MAEEVAVEQPVVEAPAAVVVTDDQNPAAQAPAEAPETPEQADKQRDARRFERKLNNARRQAAEWRAKAEFTERELNEHRQKSAPVADAGAPKIEQYDDIEKYATAKAEYAEKQALQKHEAKQRQESFARQQQKLAADWQTKVSKADSKYDDFDEVVGELNPNAPWSVAIMQADNGDDIAYYLGTHMEDARRIAALDPVAQIREIGRLEAKLAAEPPKPKETSKAPAPITPLGGASQTTNDLPSEQDDMKAWIKKRSKQVHGR